MVPIEFLRSEIEKKIGEVDAFTGIRFFSCLRQT